MIQEPPELAALIDDGRIVIGGPSVTHSDQDALNRIATALEQMVLVLLDQRVPVAPTVAPQALAALPAVQVVAERPVCPKHGPAKVAPSTKFAGFYCTAKDENGPRGYCSWQARQG